ncbi:chromatin modification-related protein EAF7-domain-containing protein [Lophiotrema nucula]|uniref:Chromatin modification-related protein EAF7-domain-containing protein n=1 Tax=Lophiotrema nucula TaxID=690887 RepID=A0A6A5ZST5_9PLEO|nr:chromatin modification-related protein EAF7-domain-containing protein [Lophiotrema nucula]
MAPRKRAKASAASTPLAEAQPRTPQDSGPTAQSQDLGSPPQNENLLNDPWTDDQETQLFKSMVRWKPTGMHKHFRMISIQNNMRSHGFVTDDTPHTRIPGIWRRLNNLYELPALDAREDAYTFNDAPDPTEPKESGQLPDFELPEEEFGELIWQKRFHGPESDASSSPPLMPIEDDKGLYQPGFGLLTDLPNGPSSQQAESAGDPSPAKGKSARSSKAGTKGGAKGKAGQSSKNSKAQASESEEEESDTNEDEGGGEDEESAESEEEAAPSTRRSNRTGRARAGTTTKRTRKR